MDNSHRRSATLANRNRQAEGLSPASEVLASKGNLVP